MKMYGFSITHFGPLIFPILYVCYVDMCDQNEEFFIDEKIPIMFSSSEKGGRVKKWDDDEL